MQVLPIFGALESEERKELLLSVSQRSSMQFLVRSALTWSLTLSQSYGEPNEVSPKIRCLQKQMSILQTFLK